MAESNRVSEIIRQQREYFRSGATRSYEFRKGELNRLKESLNLHQEKILGALHKDLGKPAFEGYVGEVGFILDEIKHTVKHLSSWMKPEKVSTPLLHFPATSRIYSEPLGTCLVIGPWNYPFQLVLSPLVGALAAGNCAVLKPSELAPETSKAIANFIKDTFDPKLVAVVEGGIEASTALLAERFDHIFFTGGFEVGRVVMSAAAKFLTPVTLELGGKSPCIVDSETQLEHTARRITWGKFFNAGQTCVAPDYLMVSEALKEPLIKAIRENVREFFGEDPSTSPDFGRIINERHFLRLTGLLKDGKIVEGGKSDARSRYLSPTVLDDVKADSKIMADEIFGPLLPVLTYSSLDEAIEFVNDRPKPLALYFFSSNKANQDRVLERTSFGGGCINDTVIHLSNPNMPFGGVGTSGLGSYHGKFGFDTFSHKKGITHRSFLMDPKLRYPPYKDRLALVRKFMK